MLLSIYLVIGAVITTVMWRTVNLSISSEKLNLNKHDILAIKILISVGMSMSYPIIILLVVHGIMRDKS